MRRVACLLALFAAPLIAGCGGVESDTVGVVLEHFCRYEAVSEDAEDTCFTFATNHGLDKLVHREEWGPRAQAALYALGEIKGCLSQAGPRCQPGDWPPVFTHESLLVNRYCNYGSVSAAQLVGCTRHVYRVNVLDYARRAYPTNAASYAIGDRTDCGYDSGPFCVEHRR
ncbi:MAG TPA: hypothetical protein VFK14_12440 [Solirubrobacterales bacterium]|nr:hypothetical protein [Solirubrobacterales bacterium]